MAGLGNEDVHIDTTVSGFALYQCENGGGNTAAGQNKVLKGPVTTPTDVDSNARPPGCCPRRGTTRGWCGPFHRGTHAGSLAADGVTAGEAPRCWIGWGAVWGKNSTSASYPGIPQRVFTECSLAVCSGRRGPSGMTIVDPNSRDEQSRVADAEGRLRARFPQLPADEVARAVELSHRELDGAPVRDFVPILVEKRARELLTGSPSLNAN